MKKIHAKSSCCGVKIIHFGARRNQCTKCHRTWRNRKKKRGRKQKRTSKNIVKKYFSRTLPSSYGRAKEQKVSSDKYEYRLLQSRNLFSRNTEWPILPKTGSVILVADAKKKKICGKMTTIYFILVRSVSGTTAFVHKPHIEIGDESVAGWDRAFDTLPESVSKRVLGLVCDGHLGLIYSARWRYWKIQRCHFHLLKSLVVRRSIKSTRGNAVVGAKILLLVGTILTTKNNETLKRAINEIEAIGWESKKGMLRAIIEGFLNHLDEYRTYLNYPELHLPKTSNSAEAYIGGLQKLLNQAHGFRTQKSLLKWLEAYIKWRKNISCNPSDYQPN
jgi:hypothetical protein